MYSYDYFEAVCNDVRKEIAESWADRLADFETLDELREALNDELSVCDHVTGNASGSYTFSTWQAEEYLAHNWDVLEEACAAFGADMGEVVKKGAENADVLIRCYYLGAAIDKVLPDFEKDFNAAQELKAFEDFENAESGIFNGFEMAEIFHKKYSKYNAIEWGYADDCADFTSSAGAVIHTGADGVKVYLMTESAVKSGGCKQVHFNRSVYVF